MNIPEPLDARPLIKKIDRELIELLEGLSPGEWNRKINRMWSVKDAVSHLLDSNLRRISFQRDHHPAPSPINDLTDHNAMIRFLAELNQEWVSVSKRISPRLILELFEFTSRKTYELYDNLDLQDEALFAVSWAGHSSSPNWLDIAREFTEKWYHQQQIRSTTGRELQTEAKWLEPLINTFMRGMPHAFDRYAPCPFAFSIHSKKSETNK